MTTKAKVTPIKVSLAFVRAVPADLYTFASSVYSGMNGNAAYPTPPVEMPAFKAAIDAYDTLLAAALDGSKKVLTQRNHQGEVLIKILRRLAHYVEGACKDDMTTFSSSGFQAVSKTRSTTPSLSQSIRKITQGSSSGVLLVWLIAIAGALSYEIRWVAVPAGSNPPATPAWTSMLVPSTHPPTTVSNLTPGTTYVFQARAVIQNGYSNWGDPIARIAV